VHPQQVSTCGSTAGLCSDVKYVLRSNISIAGGLGLAAEIPICINEVYLVSNIGGLSGLILPEASRIERSRTIGFHRRAVFVTPFSCRAVLAGKEADLGLF